MARLKAANSSASNSYSPVPNAVAQQRPAACGPRRARESHRHIQPWRGVKEGVKIAFVLLIRIHQLLQASYIQLVADNVEIVRGAARAQADYRRRGGRREALLPDFVIGASASYYSGRLLTTNPRDFFLAFPP